MIGRPPRASVPQIALTLDLDGLDAEAVEAACFEAGALAVTYSDQRDDPVLEPLPGEVRLWPATRLQALFDAGSLPPAQLVFLAADIGCDVGRLQVCAVEDKAWEREWLRDFKPMRFGERLWIQPSHMAVDAPDAVIVELDPGLAFGTGTHPTTRLCLEYLDTAAHADGGLAGLRVVDYGCGSGVLAVAALKLGAAEALVHDIDPQALTATRDNADRNGVADRLQVFATQEDLMAAVAAADSHSGSGGADIVLANILAGPLQELAPQLRALLKPGGTLVLAGLLDEQADELVAAYGEEPALARWRSLDGWTCLVGTTRAPAPVDFSPPPPAAAPRGTGALLALLALLLAGQLAWHGRAWLAGLPSIGPAVKDIAAVLGRPLQPDWDPRAYEVVQQGASEGDAPGFLTVRATLRNTAAVPQPAPLLRLVLVDAQGRTVARRDLLPAEYAPAAAAARTTPSLAPRARLTAEFSAQDPGARVVGFELDACLPRADRAPVCAHGATP